MIFIIQHHANGQCKIDALVGEEIEGRGAFYGSVAAPNGSIAFLSKLAE